MTAQLKQKYTLEEYVEIERKSEERYEYFNGNIWSMAGASHIHERIVVNFGAHLRDVFRGKNCSVFGSNLKIDVPDYPPYRYPGLSAYCGDGNFDKQGGLDILMNPQMIIEVLSNSTEAFDRGNKFNYYKSIETFVEYILVSTQSPHITQFFKNENGDWVNRDFVGLETIFHSPTFDAEISLAEIYLNVEFPPEEETSPFTFER